MSALPGAAAQFVSIVPVALISSWLGMRGGLLLAMGFIPLLAGLTVLAQGESWSYMLLEGRPAALISLVTMAGVAGKAGDLAHRLGRERKIASVHAERFQRLAGDRSSLVALGISLANAYSLYEVYAASEAWIRECLQPDRISFVDVDEVSSFGEIKHVFGVEVEGFRVGDRFAVDRRWQDRIDHRKARNGDGSSSMAIERLEEWTAAGFGTVLRLPLTTEDHVTGYLAICFYRSNALNADHLELLRAAAQHIAPNLRAASLFDTNLRQAELRKARNEVARAISMNAGADSLCDVAASQMEQMLNFDLGIISETVQGGDSLKVRRSFGRRSSLVEPGTQFQWDPDLTHLDDEVRYWNLDSIEIGGDAYPFSMFADEGFRTVAMVTLMSEGEPVGWMTLASSDTSLNHADTTQLMRGIGAHVANAFIKSRVEAEQRKLLKKLAVQNKELRSARAHLEASKLEIEQQNQKLQEANEAKNTFLSAVSHELKTPLAIMVGFAELLGMNVPGNLNEQQLDQLRMVERNGRHLDLLVSDLVDVSRIESGRLAVNLEPTDPARVLNETLEGLDAIAAEKQQTLIREFALDEAWVRADRARLGQVVTNLVTNACKYSPEKSKVKISARVVGHELEFVVADQGIGITKEDQKKLFTPFFRSSNEEAQKEKGTGLGLVITRSIVEMHGGELELESDLGKGTTITVRMPGVMESDTEETGPDESSNETTSPEAA